MCVCIQLELHIRVCIPGKVASDTLIFAVVVTYWCQYI